MRTKDEIINAMDKIRNRINDKNIPMELEDWAYSEGQYKILSWVMNNTEVPKNDLLAGANNDTIKNAQRRLSEQTGFGIPQNYCEDDH